MQRPPTLGAGTLIGGDYRVLERIGSGGMGAVYVAEQVSTGRRRALKVLHPELVPDPKSVERFVEEARTSGRIPSEHVVQVLGAGVDRDPMVPWIAMELLEGEDLAATIEREGALPPEVVREVMRQLGHAVGAAHRMGIVHRDLKPENLFVAKSQRVSETLTLKVLDFGIAKTLAHSATAVTSTSAIGSPLFMSPEQMSPGTQLRPATDVWAIGLIAFEALSGRSYWRAANHTPFNLQALFSEVLVHPIERASVRAQELGVHARMPQGFDAWFARCVARDPAARFPEAGACVDAYVQLSASPFDASRLGGAAGSASSPGLAATQALSGPAGSASAPGLAATQALGGSPPAAHMAGGASRGGFDPGSSHGGFAPPPGGQASFPAHASYSPRPAAVASRGGTGAMLAVALGVLGLLVTTCAIGAVFVVRGNDAPPPVVGGPAQPAPPPPASPTTPPVPTPGLAPMPAPVPTPGLAPAPPPPVEGPSGTLVVNTMPYSEVFVDGVRVGNTPVRIEVPVGTHLVRMQSADGALEEREVVVREGQRESVIVRLDPGSQGEPPRPAEPSTPTQQTPSRADVVGAMNAVRPAVEACSDGTVGVVPVRISFASDGRVRAVTASGSQSPPVRACVERAVRGARVAPFRQDSFSVNYPFRV